MTPDATYRVVMVAACPFPSLRGSQVLIRQFAEGLANAGHTVHVVTYPTAQHIVPLPPIAIHRVPKLPGLWTARSFGWQKIFLDLLLCCLLLRVVRRERIQIIHAHNVEGGLVAFLVRVFTRVPVIYHAHNALSDELPLYFRSQTIRRGSKRLGAFVDRQLATRADMSIALSDRLAAFLAVRGAAGRVVNIPPPVGPMPVHGQPQVKRAGRPLIMYAGNLDPYQNLHGLLAGFDRVCAAAPQARLVFVTHSGGTPEVKRRAVQLGCRPGVSVCVVNSFAAANRELKEADVLVCPRASWSGFPIKSLNYMALGRPIVHARTSAHAIEDGVTGLLFSDDDPISLAEAILRIVRDPALGAQLSRAAQSAVWRRYTWSRILPNLLDVYRRVLGDGAAGDDRQRRREMDPLIETAPLACVGARDNRSWY